MKSVFDSKKVAVEKIIQDSNIINSLLILYGKISDFGFRFVRPRLQFDNKQAYYIVIVRY